MQILLIRNWKLFLLFVIQSFILESLIFVVCTNINVCDNYFDDIFFIQMMICILICCFTCTYLLVYILKI